MTSIEITRPAASGEGTSVAIDGVEMSRSLKSLRVDADGPHPPSVVVEFAVTENFRLCAPDAELFIDPTVVDLLVRNGWTRPGVSS